MCFFLLLFYICVTNCVFYLSKVSKNYVHFLYDDVCMKAPLHPILHLLAGLISCRTAPPSVHPPHLTISDTLGGEAEQTVSCWRIHLARKRGEGEGFSQFRV